MSAPKPARPSPDSPSVKTFAEIEAEDPGFKGTLERLRRRQKAKASESGAETFAGLLASIEARVGRFRGEVDKRRDATWEPK